MTPDPETLREAAQTLLDALADPLTAGPQRADAVGALRAALAGRPPVDPPLAPHPYSPDAMAMGDCRKCGHVADSPLHERPPVAPAPDADRERLTGRDVHREWRDGMLAQGREVAPERMSWETLDQRDRDLDDGIAARLAGVHPAAPEPADRERLAEWRAADGIARAWADGGWRSPSEAAGVHPAAPDDRLRGAAQAVVDWVMSSDDDELLARVDALRAALAPSEPTDG